MSGGNDNSNVAPIRRAIPGMPKTDYTLDPERPAPPEPEPTSTPPPFADSQSTIQDRFPLPPPDTRPEPSPTTAPFQSSPSTANTSAKYDDTDDFNGPLPPLKTEFPQQRPLAAGVPCNYIFTVGRAGSGKSTFQSHMLRYLLTSGDHVADPDIEHARDNPNFRRMLLDWQMQWNSGTFPRPNEVKRVTEFRYIVTPNGGQKPILFGFLEISGEDFKVLVDPTRSPSEILPELSDFLNNPDIKVTFLLICQGEDMNGDDMLFSEFLNYLRVHTRRTNRLNSSIALILADPVTCQRRLAKRLKVEYRGEPLDADRFVDYFTKQTAARLAAWGDRATIATFSVGKVETRMVNGEERKIITEPSFEDTRYIFNWLYEQYTGRTVGPGFWNKTMEWLRQLGGGR